MLFSFEHMDTDSIIVKWFKKRFKPQKFCEVIAKWQTALEWNANYFENHDQPRSVSRFGDDQNFHDESARMLCVLLLSLRGTPFIYQGQEIGMTDFDFTSMDQIRDVESLNVYRLATRLHIPKSYRWKMILRSGRDNARTPMQWSAGKNAGFSTGTPWLGINGNHTKINVEAQDKDPNSVLLLCKMIGFGTNKLRSGVSASRSQESCSFSSGFDRENLVVINFPEIRRYNASGKLLSVRTNRLRRIAGSLRSGLAEREERRMIRYDNGIFFLNTNKTSYIFRITDRGHPEHIYYGSRLDDPDVASLELKRTAAVGGTVVYDESDPMYCLDILPLEWSGIGKGDFRQSPCELKMPDGTFVTDFVYQSHEIIDGPIPMSGLPGAYADPAETKTLSVVLTDRLFDLDLRLFYTVFPAVDVITRRAELRNRCDRPVIIRKMMSLMIDPTCTERTSTAVDQKRTTEPIGNGIPLENTTGAWETDQYRFSDFDPRASESFGGVYGFNLIYSGNHHRRSSVARGTVRVMTGISPHCFSGPG